MRHVARKRPSMIMILSLSILCMASVFGLAYRLIQPGRGLSQKATDAIMDYSSGSNAQSIFAIQAHLLTPGGGGTTLNGAGGRGTPTGTTSPNSTPTAQGTTPTPPGYTPTPPGYTPTPYPTSTQPPVNLTNTLPPGSALPSERACASEVAYSSFEPRPGNYGANHSVPTSSQIANLQPWGPLIGLSDNSDNLRKQITGNFTGTTDEIFQWVACKWGIDVNIVRAEAVQESDWNQSQLGDYTTNQSLCPPGKWNGSSCYQSFGVLQIKYTYFKTEWPMSEQDTAFNAEFVYGWIRNCFEGWTDYLYNLTPAPGYPKYHAGDIWGCLGFWFSGGWYTQGAINYIQIIQNDYNQKPWLKSGF